MAQVKVKKTEVNTMGQITSERIMMLSEKVWARIVADKPVKTFTRWELLSKESPVEKQLMPKKNDNEGGVDYSNYELADLREAAKNAGIKGYAVMGKDTLITKLKAQ